MPQKPPTPKSRTTPKAPEPARTGVGEAGHARGAIRFRATLLTPSAPTTRGAKAVTWSFLKLPTDASAKLPSRSMVSVEGTFNGHVFRATLEPDGEGGHWLKVPHTLREVAGVRAAGGEHTGDVVELQITPVLQEPEPKVPADFRKALSAATPKARDVWSDITPLARRDWVHWIVSAKQSQTRTRRVAAACAMLAAGKRRPCCFDRSGMYDKSLSCPTPAPVVPTSQSSKSAARSAPPKPSRPDPAS